MESDADELKEYIGQEVVLDTMSPMVYLGMLEKVGAHFVTLVQCDVYDSSESQTRKEVYIHDALKHGIKRNRERVEVRKDQIISISRLSDVTEY
ncbi:MAG: hypothetical protein GXP25_01695 [Planctomycetes bacterium]|nr:hypothetical protein [Planctomycetota bacterium]